MSWRNTTIRFTSVGWHPYVSVKRDDFGEKTLTGLTGHMLHFVIYSMGMKYQVVFPNDHEWGTLLPNGSWTGMIGDLTRNAADIAIGPFVMTQEEAIVANPSLPYADENLIILSGVHKEHETNVYGYITTMDYEVWLLLLSCCLLIMAIVGVMDHILDPYVTRRQRRTRFWRIFWVFWAAIFLEGSAIQFRSNPHRIILATWLLGVMVIMHMFIGYMESTLMVKSETFRINNVEQLLKLPSVEPMLYDIGGYKAILANAESHLFRKVMEQVKQHGDKRYGEELLSPRVLRKVLNKQAVVLMEPMSLYTRIGPQCHEFKNEGLFHLGKERLLQIKMVFYMRKQLDRRIQAEIQKRIRLTIDSGIFRHWHDTLLFDKGPCWTAEKSDHMHDYADLQVSDLASIFYFYFTALYLAFNVFLVEVLYRNGYCCCKYKNTDADEEEEQKRLLKARMKLDGVYGSFSSYRSSPTLNEMPEIDGVATPPSTIAATRIAKNVLGAPGHPGEIGFFSASSGKQFSMFPGKKLLPTDATVESSKVQNARREDTVVSAPPLVRLCSDECDDVYSNDQSQVLIASDSTQALQSDTRMYETRTGGIVLQNDDRATYSNNANPRLETSAVDIASDDDHDHDHDGDKRDEGNEGDDHDDDEETTRCLNEDNYQYVSRKMQEDLESEDAAEAETLENVYTEIDEDESVEDVPKSTGKKWLIQIDAAREDP